MWVENGKTVISYSLPESIILSGLADYNKLIQLLIHILKQFVFDFDFVFYLQFNVLCYNGATQVEHRSWNLAKLLPLSKQIGCLFVKTSKTFAK